MFPYNKCNFLEHTLLSDRALLGRFVVYRHELENIWVILLSWENMENAAIIKSKEHTEQDKQREGAEII